MNYKKTNTITGWFTWLIATYVFVSTIEPTASFWDCGEFIATAYKLEVGHPPGAPFFMLLARLFSMFVSPENAAKMINVLSALCSSFTILFLFWTITALAKKIAVQTGELTNGKIVATMGSGLVGGLAYTFSDSFWFSAVEGEVYAMSSLFTAVVFWAILKWEEVADEKHATRWIVLIAYLMGLSIGVHLLNLLAIPAMTFVYYFKKFKVSQKGIIITSIVSVFILGIVQYGVIPGVIKIAAIFELLFTNTFGAPFNTGFIVYLLLLLLLIVWGLKYTHEKGKIVWNTVILSFAVILIGYSTFAIIFIRSSANPPMDENNPENVFTMISYLNREQYGDRPLLYGQYFNSPLDPSEPYKDDSPVYFQDKKSGKYIISDEKEAAVPNYDSRFCSIFPRMYSSQSNHVRAYKEWSDFKGKPIRTMNMRGEPEIINKPTLFENLRFFFTYQVGWMYLRYFMWNFAGRQNDIQGSGELLNGNWISGINFIDEMRVGKQDKLPESITSNKARNKFYFLPLILGLIGLFYQLNKNKRDWVVVLLLFFFTGLAIVIYLNQYPYQPRERDYAYAASFYTFAIWIGLGVLAIFETLSKKMDTFLSAVITTFLCLLLVPAVMAKDGWDDHDRSGLYTARDFAKNYLESCAPNAILFTNGDNDTFPLWYVQEVEGFRTDVRVVNLSLLNTDWYINQMKRKAYDSDAVPFKMEEEMYRQGTRDYLPIIDKNKAGLYVDLKDVMNFITSEDTKALFSSNKRMNYIPTSKFSLHVDSAKVIANNTVPKHLQDQIVSAIEWEMNRSYILKNDIMILDLLANNDWNRPVYFAITTGNSSYIGLESYFQLEGLAYRLIPVKVGNTDGQTGMVNTDIMYDNLMNKFKWGGMENKFLYMNENNRRMTMNMRNNFARLAESLLREGKKDKALEVLNRCMEVMPEESIPYNFFILPVAEAFYKLEATEQANAIAKRLADLYEQDLNYYIKLKPDQLKSVSSEVQQALAVMQRLSVLTTKAYPQEELGKEISEKFNTLQQLYSSMMQ